MVCRFLDIVTLKEINQQKKKQKNYPQKRVMYHPHNADKKKLIKIIIKVELEKHWLKPITELREIKNSIVRWNNLNLKKKNPYLIGYKLHTELTYGYLMQRAVPTCETCREELTVKHILIQYRKYKDTMANLELSNTLSTISSPQQKIHTNSYFF